MYCIREIWVIDKQNYFEALWRNRERSDRILRPEENLGNYCVISVILLYNKFKEKSMNKQDKDDKYWKIIEV